MSKTMTARMPSRALHIALALALLTSLALVGFGQAAATSADDVQLIVEVDRGGPPSHADFQRAGATSVRALEFVPNTVVVTAPGQREAAIARVRGVSSVERDVLMTIDHHCVSPDHPRHNNCDEEPEPEPSPSPTEEPDDPEPSTQTTPWGIDKIQAPAAWATSTGQGVGVCIADTGIAQSHPDLTVDRGRNFTGGPAANWDDKNGHGTHVAGSVAALDNTLGVVGVAPQAKLYAAKVLGNGGSGWTSDIANGLRWCADQGAKVINMSFGSSSSTSTMHDAVKYAAGKGVVLVAASGNSGASQPGFPARYAEVIAVGATDSGDGIASWSNRGEEINAPGVAVESTVPGGYATYSGTSMASPHVAGAAALVIDAKPSLTPAQVRSTLTSTADGIAGGAIRLNAAAAVG